MATHNEKLIHPDDRVIILENGKLKEDKHGKKKHHKEEKEEKEEEKDAS